MHLGIIVASFWDHFGICLGPGHLFGTCGHHFGTAGHHCGTPGQQVVVWGGAFIEFSEFPVRFWTLWGSPFSPLVVTISFPGVWNDGNSVFCGQPDSRLDIGTKSDQFLECLEWLRPRFGVGGVVKITFSVEHGFSRFWHPFW